MAAVKLYANTFGQVTKTAEPSDSDTARPTFCGRGD
jgi:hypothetical protein